MMYTEVLLPTECDFECYETDRDRILGEFSGVNLLVGSNNSGKSRLLRMLFRDLGSLRFKTRELCRKELIDFRTQLKGGIEDALPPGISFQPFDDWDEHAPPDPESEFFGPESSEFEEVEFRLNQVAEAKPEMLRAEVDFSEDKNLDELAASLREVGVQLHWEFKEKWAQDRFAPMHHRLYIPVLRGLRPLGDKQEDLYEVKTKKDYFTAPGPNAGVGGQISNPVFTGLGLYADLKERIAGTPELRKGLVDFQAFLSRTFFGGRSVELTPRSDSDTVHIKIGNEPEFPIHHVGDGIQNVIAMLFNVFVWEGDPRAYFIEEPELSLHPGYQRVLLETLFAFCRDRGDQFFLTTHSNHLLDMTLDYSDMSIFRFRKHVEGDGPPQFRVTAVTEPDRSLLADLGVRNASVFLTDATIWVEGVTDRRYLRGYLARYLADLPVGDSRTRLREDVHYSFAEYGGGNLVHWSFAEPGDPEAIDAARLCGSPLLVADGDSLKKGDRRGKYQAQLGMHAIYETPGKEIENLLPLEILRRWVLKKLPDVDVSCLRYDEYVGSSTGIGAYLDEQVGVALFSENEAGTIRQKVELCDFAIKLMGDATFEWTMPQPVSDLCERVLEHVDASLGGKPVSG